MQWQLLPAAVMMTVLIWLGALAVSILLSIPLTLLRRSRFGFARAVGAIWATLARGIPPIVWLILLYFGVASGLLKDVPAVSAIVGLGLVNSAYVSDSIRAGLDSVPTGQWEAIRATGLPRAVGLVRVILPQAFPIMLASTAAYSITLLKNTALASIIGANELIFFISNSVQQGADPLPAFLLAGVIYMVFTVPVGFFARWIEGRSVIAMVR